MPPEPKRKTAALSHSSGGSGRIENSLSPSSPMELRMNVSGNFSDFMTSDDEEGSAKGQHSLKSKPFSLSGISTFKHKNAPLGNAHKLPEIEENKSIQAKNS